MSEEYEQHICSSCGDFFLSNTVCSICNEVLADKCLCCHRELKHEIIEIQNLHIVSSPDSGLDSIENDPDAYSPSWKAGNNL